MLYNNMTDLIGDTPLVRIDPAIHDLKHIDLYAKLEMMNPFGSVKDRVALSMVEDELEMLQETNTSVIEFSSGNTAKALAAICSKNNIPFKTITNRIKVPEVKKQLLVMGAEVQELAGRSECLDPNNDNDPMAEVYRTLSASDKKVLHTDQYFNPRNPAAHAAGTGREIIKDLDGAPDWFITGVGTSGSSTGTAVPLREDNPDCKVIGLVSERNDVIPGIRNSDETLEVGLFDPDNYDAICTVNSQDAIDSMLTLIRKCAILGGPTSGANFRGAVDYLRPIDDELDAAGDVVERERAVFIVCDRFESYMSYIEKRRPEIFSASAASDSDRREVCSTPEALSRVEQVAPQDAAQWVEQNNALIIDLRSAFAYKSLHIEGSMNINEQLFDELLESGLPVDRAKPVLVVCPIGEQSVRAAATLVHYGHGDVRSLQGGITAWKRARLPLVRS